MPNDKTTTVKPFVKPGEQLGYVAILKERGSWPPKLNSGKDNDGNKGKPVATPFLVVPVAPGDNGSRPKPDSLVFHSQGVWIEDITAPGIHVTVPVVGKEYKVKCVITNLGAMGSYGGLADFFINKPATFNADAGTNAVLPALGHTGFSVIQGQTISVTCPRTWKPGSAADLASSIVVHAYDPFADMINKKYDARDDRHVGRLDFTSDFYVRDWTDTAASHDMGTEPSTNAVFYHTSDIWNRRSNNQGAFLNDQPQNENPQAGNAAAGDNFVFARISRNNDTTKETVFAHFMFAEFGTGSPYVDCSPAPDPSVVFNVGDKTKIISLPWHLHPSSSTHLCMGVQIYTDADPFIAPGLVGYTPGWPTTDMMVINDNNKAQRNMTVWDGTADAPFQQMAMIFNAATFVRDVNLHVIADAQTAAKLVNAKVSVAGSQDSISFKANTQLMLKGMLPGERRWVSLSGDGFKAKDGETLSVFFNEVENNITLNGFSLSMQAVAPVSLIAGIMNIQASVFHRMAEGMNLKSAADGIKFHQQLVVKNDVAEYQKNLPAAIQLLRASTNEFSAANGAVKDIFGVEETFRVLNTSIPAGQVQKTLAIHNVLLQKLDAWHTMVQKSNGDEAVILFTVRVQKDLYSKGKLSATRRFDELLKASDDFIGKYSGNTAEYVSLVNKLLDSFKITLDLFSANTGAVKSCYDLLVRSLGLKDAAKTQKAHLDFLNAVLLNINTIR